MNYDNSSYWENIHKQYPGRLKAVGHSNLSETINKLKYISETASVSSCLNKIINYFKDSEKEKIFILDVGAGIGYWTAFFFEIFSDQNFQFELNALDISQEALNGLKNNNLQVNSLRRDLRTIDIEEFIAEFDLVISFYCLHHLVNLDDFLNGLRFSAKSVANEGFLMIMDPILTLPYSMFDVIDFPSFQGNGIPRHLYLIEDIIYKEGFERIKLQPAASFLLNGPIEGHGPFRYLAADLIWKMFCKLIYPKDILVKLIYRELNVVDRICKRLGMAYSSSIGVYQKIK